MRGGTRRPRVLPERIPLLGNYLNSAIIL